MKDLTKGNEASLIFKFTLPMLIGNVFQQSHQIANTIIVGKFIGADATASVGATFPITFALVALVMGVGIGGSVVVSQYFGARQLGMVKRASDTIIIFLTLAGFVMGGIGMLFSRPILEITRIPTELLDNATTYFNINMVGMFAMFGYNAVASVLRGMGDSVRPLYFLIFSSVLNIAFDFLFILVFDWGIKGVAWSTVFAYIISFVLIIIYINKTHPLLKFTFKTLTFDKKIFKQSIKIGLPSGFQQTFVALGSMALTVMVNGYGKDVMAAFTAAGRIDTFISMPAMNFSGALSAFVGQNLARNKLRRIQRGFKATLLMSGAVCIALTLLVVFFGKNVMSLFVKSSEPGYDLIIATGHQYLVIVCSFYIVFSSMFVINGLLRGAGSTIVPMFVTLFSLWIIRLPIAYFLSEVLALGTKGIWWSIPVGWALGLFGSYIYYLSGRWKGKAVVQLEISENGNL